MTLNPTSWAAWIGAGTGVAGLVWNIYLKLSAGPKLKVCAYADMISMSPQPGNPRFMRVIVRNVGTAPTTITLYSIHSFKGFRSRFRKTEFNAARSAILNEYRGHNARQDCKSEKK